MMGILAVMLFFGQLFTITGWSGVVYWGFAFCLTIWLIFMAFGDVTATRVQVARSRQSLLMEQAKLQREINEIRQQEANGAETNGTETNGTETNGTETNGTGPDGAGADE